MRRGCRERFPHHRLQRKPLVSDPGMQHDTCVTHVLGCMSGSLTRGGGESIPGACVSRNFAYVGRGPWYMTDAWYTHVSADHHQPASRGSTSKKTYKTYHDSKVHGANMGHTCDRQDPGWPHVGPANLAIGYTGLSDWNICVGRGSIVTCNYDTQYTQVTLIKISTDEYMCFFCSNLFNIHSVQLCCDISTLLIKRTKLMCYVCFTQSPKVNGHRCVFRREEVSIPIFFISMYPQCLIQSKFALVRLLNIYGVIGPYFTRFICDIYVLICLVSLCLHNVIICFWSANSMFSFNC